MGYKYANGCEKPSMEHPGELAASRGLRSSSDSTSYSVPLFMSKTGLHTVWTQISSFTNQSRTELKTQNVHTKIMWHKVGAADTKQRDVSLCNKASKKRFEGDMPREPCLWFNSALSKEEEGLSETQTHTLRGRCSRHSLVLSNSMQRE